MREASYITRDDSGSLVCRLCPHQCRMIDGKAGLCRIRVRQGEKVFSHNYGKITAMALDPIEKKPLYHFYPGSMILSVGTTGCNFACGFCQNWRISQEEADGMQVAPEKLVETAENHRKEGNIGVAFTYSEPAVWWEYMMDVTPLLREAGLKSVMVTNGFLSSEPWEELVPYLHAVNLDVKGFTSEFYRRHCRGLLEPVLQTAQSLVGRVHLELTNLLIPEENDSRKELESFVQWVAVELGPDTPVHFTRYYPQYKMDRPPTPLQRLKEAYSIARERLNFVYIGNHSETGLMDTHCPNCGNTWIERNGFAIRKVGLVEGKCSACGLVAAIIRK